MVQRAIRRDPQLVDALTWAYLNDADVPPGTSRGDVFGRTDAIMRDLDGLPPLATLWQEHRETILQTWLRANPGTRPTAWWRYDAPHWLPADLPPRWRGTYFAADLRAPRLRVGGTGTATHDALNHVPRFTRGMPAAWLTADDVTRFAKHGPFPFAAYDPDDPPTFEAQAVYLRRHGLLTPAEVKQYALGTLDTDPEAVLDGRASTEE